MAGIKITCETCNSEFLVKPYMAQTRRWCSNSCRRNRFQITCKTCGQVFEVTKCRANTAKWCSRDCAGTNAFEFWEHVAKSNNCWTWTAGTDKDGYGKFQGGRAHRASYEMANGEIPDHLCVLHRCDNPPCVRPDHLFLGTNRENMDDKIRKGRQFRGEQLKGLCKLSEHKVRQIRQLAKDGNTHQAIADQFGVDRTNIGFVVRRETWAHIT